jgi:endonuclease YncB( thermonuclease family)
MQIVRTLAVVVVATTAAHPSHTRSDPVLVTAVPDGRTIQVAAIGRVQLLGIEIPESDRNRAAGRPPAHDARERLAALVLHRWVRLEEESSHPSPGRRGRRAYVITEDGQFVNAILVREGLVRVNARAPLSRLAELNRAQDDAKAARRGIWARSGTD